MSARNFKPATPNNPAKNQKDQSEQGNIQACTNKNLKDKESAPAQNPNNKMKKEAAVFPLQKFLNLGFKHHFAEYLDAPSLGELRRISLKHHSLFSKHMWAFYLLDFVLNNRQEQMMAILIHLRLHPEDFEAILLKRNGQEKYFGFKTKELQVKTNWFGISPLQAAFLTGNIKLARILLDFLPDQFVDRAKKQIEELTRSPKVAEANKDKAKALEPSFPQPFPQPKDAKEKASALIVAAPKTTQDKKGLTPPAVTARNDEFLAFYQATIKANRDFYMAYDAIEAEHDEHDPQQREIRLEQLKPLWQARASAQRLLPERGLDKLFDRTPTPAWIKDANDDDVKIEILNFSTAEFVKQKQDSDLQFFIKKHRIENKVPKTLNVRIQCVLNYESWPLDLESIGCEPYIALARMPEGGIKAIRMYFMTPDLVPAARAEAQGLENFYNTVIKETKDIINTLETLDTRWKEFNKSQSEPQSEPQKAKTLPGASLPLAHSKTEKTEKEAGEKSSHGQEKSRQNAIPNKNGQQAIPKKPLVFNRNYKFNLQRLPYSDPSLQAAVSSAVSEARKKKSWCLIS